MNLTPAEHFWGLWLVYCYIALIAICVIQFIDEKPWRKR